MSGGRERGSGLARSGRGRGAPREGSRTARLKPGSKVGEHARSRSGNTSSWLPWVSARSSRGQHGRSAREGTPKVSRPSQHGPVIVVRNGVVVCRRVDEMVVVGVHGHRGRDQTAEFWRIWEEGRPQRGEKECRRDRRKAEQVVVAAQLAAASKRRTPALDSRASRSGPQPPPPQQTHTAT